MILFDPRRGGDPIARGRPPLSNGYQRRRRRQKKKKECDGEEVVVGSVFATILKAFEECGYDVSWKVVNSRHVSLFPSLVASSPSHLLSCMCTSNPQF